MATATANSKKTVKQKLATAKAKMKEEIAAGKKMIEDGKQKFKKYKEKLKVVKNVGYASGQQDYKKLPKVAGAKLAATTGYNNALKDTGKIDKLQKKGAKINGNVKK